MLKSLLNFHQLLLGQHQPRGLLLLLNLRDDAGPLLRLRAFRSRKSDEGVLVRPQPIVDRNFMLAQLQGILVAGLEDGVLLVDQLDHGQVPRQVGVPGSHLVIETPGLWLIPVLTSVQHLDQDVPRLLPGGRGRELHRVHLSLLGQEDLVPEGAVHEIDRADVGLGVGHEELLPEHEVVHRGLGRQVLVEVVLVHL